MGQLCTPARESAAHYHLRLACIQAAEPPFVPYLLVIPDGLPLRECHKNYITKGFGLSLLDLIHVIVFFFFHVSVPCLTGLYSC